MVPNTISKTTSNRRKITDQTPQGPHLVPLFGSRICLLSIVILLQRLTWSFWMGPSCSLSSFFGPLVFVSGCMYFSLVRSRAISLVRGVVFCLICSCCLLVSGDHHISTSASVFTRLWLQLFTPHSVIPSQKCWYLVLYGCLIFEPLLSCWVGGACAAVDVVFTWKSLAQ